MIVAIRFSLMIALVFCAQAQLPLAVGSENNMISLITFEDASERENWFANPWGGGECEAKVMDGEDHEMGAFLRVSFNDARMRLSNNPLFDSLQGEWREKPVSAFYLWMRLSYEERARVNLQYVTSSGEHSYQYTQRLLSRRGEWELVRVPLGGFAIGRHGHEFQIEELRRIHFGISGTGILDIGEIGIIRPLHMQRICRWPGNKDAAISLSHISAGSGSAIDLLCPAGGFPEEAAIAVDQAVDDGIWLNLVFPASEVGSDAYQACLDYLKCLDCVIWLESPGRIREYIELRDHAGLKVKAVSSDSLRVELAVPDKFVGIKIPLTVQVGLPAGSWGAVVKSGAEPIPHEYVIEEDERGVRFDIFPGEPVNIYVR